MEVIPAAQSVDVGRSWTSQVDAVAAVCCCRALLVLTLLSVNHAADFYLTRCARRASV